MRGALIPNRSRDQRHDVVVALGQGLKDAQEELFVVMVCDGLPLALAFKRAGFESSNRSAPSNLFNLPRVQERAAAILEARKATGVVTLSQVTDMLQRVFAGAHSEGEYSAAHNAAFSLARLYGHVTDKSVIEHIRRPSRDPDAPSEQALEALAAGLPVVGESAPDPVLGPPQRAPAPLLGLGPSELTAVNSAPRAFRTPSGHDLVDVEKDQCNQALSPIDPAIDNREVDWFQGPGPGAGRSRTGNGAHGPPVTGTPNTGGHSQTLGSPLADKGTGTKMGDWPPMEDLF